jgi:E3 ubiquitin-protein ligase SHPRH
MARKKSQARRHRVDATESLPDVTNKKVCRSRDDWLPEFVRADWHNGAGAHVAVLLELSVSLLQASSVQEAELIPHLQSAVCGSGQRMLRWSDEPISAVSGFPAVFVKHWMPTKYIRSGRFESKPTKGWIGLDEFAHCDTLLSVLIVEHRQDLATDLTAVTGQATLRLRSTEITLHGCNVPLCLVSLIESRAFRIVFSAERSSLFFILSLDEVVEESRNPSFALSHVIRWVVNQEYAAGELSQADRRPAFNSDWIYATVRRSADDEDAAEHIAFIDKLRGAEAVITVPIRSYQRRAVAWMLSRELGPPVNLGTWIPWKPAASMRDIVCQMDPSMILEKHLFLNPVYGQYRVSVDSSSRTPSEINMEGNSPYPVGRGGLLCDAMGLGKTIELILLTVSHPAPENRISSSLSVNGPCDSKKMEICCECKSSVPPHNEPEAIRNRSSTFMECAECEQSVHIECSGASSGRSASYVCFSCCDRIVRLGRKDIDPSLVPQSRATIIVVPTTLLDQWRSEIEEHVDKSVCIVIFEGLSQTGYVRQRTLLDADIVLTTYDALGSDVAVARALQQARRSLRHPQRYRLTPSPLLSVRWWRLALDESQMLGHGMVAEMACNLRSRFRWCVSGTPIARGILQLLPMLRFLRIGDDTDGSMWLSHLCEPAAHGLMHDQASLQRALRKVMWRTEIGDVKTSELSLPPQTTQVVRSSLGPVEKYYYKSLYNSVRSIALSKLSNSAHRNINVASELLIGLRQACCHPQVGAAGRRSGLSSGLHISLRKEQARSRVNRDPSEQASARAKRPLTMEEVLDALVAKSRLECQESLRVLVASSNGLAGVSMLQHNQQTESKRYDYLAKAVGLYRNTIRIANDNQNLVKVDNIQRMHILHNLSDSLDLVRVLQEASNGDSELIARLGPLERKPEENEYREDVLRLKSSYIADASARLGAAMVEYENFRLAATFQEGGVPSREDDCEADRSSANAIPRVQWWERALGIIMESEDSTSFLERLIQMLMRSLPRDISNVRTISTRMISFFAIHGVLQSELEELEKARKALQLRILKLPGAETPSNSEISQSGQCRICREIGTGPPCFHCRSEHLFVNVDRILYSIRESIDEDVDTSENEGKATRRAGISHATDEKPPNRPQNVKNIKAALSEMFGSGEHKWRNHRSDADLRLQGEVETVMRALSGTVRSKGDVALQKAMEKWFRSLEAVKKEHVAARKVFDAQRELLGSLDEVNMALMRMALLEESEDVSSLTEQEKLFRLSPEVLPSLTAQFSEEKTAAEIEFRTKRGSLVYLTSLKRSMDSEQRKDTGRHQLLVDSRCPICLFQFDTEMAIFTCGHAYCFECTLLLIRNVPHLVRVQTVACPECRVRCLVDEINFATISSNPPSALAAVGNNGTQMLDLPISNGQQPSKKSSLECVPDATCGRASQSELYREVASTFLNENVEVTGSNGSKMAAVVRVLKSIELQFPGAKSLVFSQWTEVLEIVSSALSTNRVSHINGGAMKSSSTVASAVAKFKQSVSCNVLLLPLKRAGAGLNLTEATHVLLVEPSLNPALEAQAVSRVHRIGQNQPTFVHRFIMNSTIEDKVLDIAAGRSKSISTNMTEDVTATDFARIFAETGQQIHIDVDDG